MSGEQVRVERQGAALVITLARSERKNALTRSMYDAMTAGLQAASAEGEVRCAIVRGEGSTFCAGNDLADFLGDPPLDDSSPVVRFLHALYAFDKPLICVIHGAAVGIGTTMLLHCDLVYAAKGTRLRLPFVPLALVPEAASSLLLPRYLGHQKASELLLLGEFFDADEAWRLGLVNEVLADGDAAFDRALQRAEALAALPPTSVRLTRQLLKRASHDEVAATSAAEAALFKERLASPELAEAVSAFFDKRAPDYSGMS